MLDLPAPKFNTNKATAIIHQWDSFKGKRSSSLKVLTFLGNIICSSLKNNIIYTFVAHVKSK